jgi:hypothetical protein
MLETGQKEGGNMNEWIESKADPPPPQAKLPVLPLKTSSRVDRVARASDPPQLPTVSQAPPPMALAARPANGGVVPLATPAPTSTQVQAIPGPGKLAKSGRTQAPSVADTRPAAAYDTVVFDPLTGFGSSDVPVPFDQFDVTARSKPQAESKKAAPLGGLSSQSFLRGVPSWLASFVFHLTLILVLALMTVAADKGSKIEFLMSGQPRAQEMDFMEVAIEVDSATEDDDKEKLLTDSQDIQSDLQRLDVNLDHLNDRLSDPLAATNMLLPAKIEFERGDGKGASFFGTGALGTKFVFVVDCSGSMQEEYRWVMARRELKEAIEGLTKNQQFYVFLYNDTSFAFSGQQATLMPATEKNKEKIFKWLDKQNPIGDTRPWKAMRLSLRMKPDAIFLLSDGELKDDTVPRLRLENREKTSGDGKIGKIPVHTISLGSGFGSVTMREIANENDGTFTLVNTW